MLDKNFIMVWKTLECRSNRTNTLLRYTTYFSLCQYFMLLFFSSQSKIMNVNHLQPQPIRLVSKL